MFHKPNDIRLHVAERSRDMPALLRYPIQPSNHLRYVIGPIGEMATPSWFSSSSNQLEEITAGGMKLDSQVSQLVQAMATYSASNSGFDPTAPKDDEVAPRSCDFQANANGPDVLRFERFLLADEQALIPRTLVSDDWTYKHGGISATPPSESLYRERTTYNY